MNTEWTSTPDESEPFNAGVRGNAAIEAILMDFDFSRVSDCMKKMNWTWRNSPTPPTVDEMKDCIRTLALEIMILSRHSFATVRMSWGGFVVSRNKEGRWNVSFVISEGTSKERPPRPSRRSSR